jgi:hypothetical protein
MFIYFALGEPLRGAHGVLTHLCLRRSRRAIRSITRKAHEVRGAGGSATIPLATAASLPPRPNIILYNANIYNWLQFYLFYFTNNAN